MTTVLLFNRSNHSMSILIITHNSPWRLGRCSFVALVIKHIRVFLGIRWLLLVIIIGVWGWIIMIIIFIGMAAFFLWTCYSLLIILNVLMSISRWRIIIVEVMMLFACICNSNSWASIISLWIIIHSCCLRG